MAYEPIILVPLFQDLLLTTNGTPLSKLVMDLKVPRFTNLLPQSQAMFLITDTGGLPSSGVVQWNVAFHSGFDRNHEKSGGPFDIAAAPLNIDGAFRSAEYTTTANFLLESRLQLWWQNDSGVNGPKTFRASAVLGLRMYGA